MKMIDAVASLAIILIAVTSVKAQAIQYQVIGPCSAAAVHSGEFSVNDLGKSVGQISLEIFDQQAIPYVGTESGFNSILNTPTGSDSIEVISDTKMRAYGWCYFVNGVGPDVMAGDYHFAGNDDKLTWIYAYSTYDNGQWLDYCVPSYRIRAPQFCRN